MATSFVKENDDAPRDTEVMTSTREVPGRPLAGRKIAIVYDGLYPWSIGGIERWYRALAERLVDAGADVWYLTRLQWDDPPDIRGVQVVAIVGRQVLYREDGKRRTIQPLRFGWKSFTWLVRNRRQYDAVHVCNFPYFSLIAARLALAFTNTPVSVDWFEVWRLSLWRKYAGAFAGLVGYLIQSLCIRLTTTAFVFWDPIARQLRAQGYSGDLKVLPGLLPTTKLEASSRIRESDSQPSIFFSGRHIRDKGMRLLPDSLESLRLEVPEILMVIAGEGPETNLIRSMFQQRGLLENVEFTGKVPDERLHQLIRSASCAVVPSLREGYGLAVVEAASFGTPSVVANYPENAATGHIVDGINGFVVQPSAQGIAEGVHRVLEAGLGLRRRTFDWFQERADAMSIERSTAEVAKYYVERLRSPSLDA